MSRRVKEFVDVEDHLSLDGLIQKLGEIRDGLPEGAAAELRLRGDDIFGHRITVTYFRDQTADEAELHEKYSSPDDAEMDELQRKLDEVPYAARKSN